MKITTQDEKRYKTAEISLKTSLTHNARQLLVTTETGFMVKSVFYAGNSFNLT